MKLLIISQDPAILREDSSAHQRVRFYAGTGDEWHMIVMSEEVHVARAYTNLFVYPACARSRILQRFQAYRRAAALCRAMHFDVISAQGPDETGLIAFALSRRFHIPLQLQVHTDVMSKWYRKASWKEFARYYLAQFLLPRAQCIRVVSERIAKSIASHFQYPLSCLSILPIFTDIKNFIDATHDEKIEARFRNYSFKMIAVGRFMEKEKNFSLLFFMMREFVTLCPDALLVVVGEGPDRKYYESMRHRHHLEKNVIIEPWRNDLASFYQSFDLFLLPSNFEGWGAAVLEAMASGLAVVMTDVGLAGEVITDGENGRVVPVGSVKDFFSAINDLYRDQKKRYLFAERGRATVQQYVEETKSRYLSRMKKSFELCINKCL